MTNEGRIFRISWKDNDKTEHRPAARATNGDNGSPRHRPGALAGRVAKLAGPPPHVGLVRRAYAAAAGSCNRQNIHDHTPQCATSRGRRCRLRRLCVV